MAVYTFSALTSGQAISFDPSSDVLNFDQATISAADLGVAAEGADARLTLLSGVDAGKSVVLQGVSPLALASSNVTFSNASLLLFGDNSPGTGADDAANTLNGTSGNDLLRGFGGADTLNGGSGDDAYVVGAGDVITDTGGIDTIYTDISWTVSANIENLTMTGTANINADGNALGNLITGNSGNNVAWAGNSSDTVIGGDGNDDLHGEAGDDWMEGGGGNDTLGGGGDRDHIAFREYGAANADTVISFASNWDDVQLDIAAFTALGTTGRFASGDARFYAAAGANAGHDADDRIIYDTSTGQVWYDADGSGSGAAQLIATLDGAPTLVAADLWVFGTPPNSGQVLTGTAGNDTLNGGPGDDTITGLGGNDSLTGWGGADSISGGDGDDRLYGSRVDAITGVPGDGNDTVSGGAGNDDIGGGEGDDLLSGDAGNDTLSGLSGNDTLLGGDGNDYLGLYASFGYGDIDVLDGGAGNDTVSLYAGGSQIGSWTATIDLHAGTVTPRNGGSGLATLVNIENAEGSTGDDLILGDANNNILTGNEGADTLDGAEGNDTLWGTGSSSMSSPADTYVFSATPGDANADVIRSFTSRAGHYNFDTLRLDANVMPALGANGFFTAGDARFYSASGATGGHDADDRVIFNSATGQLFYDADGNGPGAAQLLFTLQSGAPQAQDIEVINGSGAGPAVNGTAGNDTLIGGPGNDTLNGLDGNDSLVGNDGDDSLDGGNGDDTLDGGQGNDSYVVTSSDVLIDAGGIDTVISAGSWTLARDFENLTLAGSGYWEAQGNNLANLIIGNSGGNYINSRAGDDTIQGGGGSDSIDISTGGTSTYGTKVIDGGADFDTIDIDGYAKSAIVVNLAAGTMHGGGEAGAGSATLSNIERVVGGSFDDNIAGDANANQIEGRNGNDSLAGGPGIDTLVGGAGSDSFVFADFGIANGDRIADFASGVDSIHLDSGAFANLGAVGQFAAGDARFYSAAGASAGHDADDRIVFNTSTGQLFYDADGSGAAASQLIATLQPGATLGAPDIYCDSPSSPPPGSIAGTQGNDSLTGTPGSDSMQGLGGNDTLDGGDGNDTLDGGPGDDSLFGGAGQDSFIGGDGNDTLDGWFAFFADIEPVAETMDGGLGNDRFYVDNPGDSLFDAGGTDTVVAKNIDWTLGVGFENLVMNNGEAESTRSGIGNELDNVLDGRSTMVMQTGGDGWSVDLHGLAGNDTLLGSVRDDTLSGGTGNDVLTGDQHFDTFLFDVAPGAANADVVTDFATAEDTIELDGSVYANTGPSGRFASGDARFYAAAGANAGHDADDRVVYDTSSGNLWYDADGNGTSGAQLVGTLQGAPALSASDISIINGTASPAPAGTFDNIQEVIFAPMSGNIEVDALLGGFFNAWDRLTPSDLVLQYTFSVSEGNLAGFDVAAFSAADQAAARQAIAQAASITGIRFEEVSDGNAAELHFARSNTIAPNSGATAGSRDITLDTDGHLTHYDADTYMYFVPNMDLSPGTFGYQAVLHELGHALGLVHPHDVPIILLPDIDDNHHTVMTYQNIYAPVSDYQPLDVAALQWLYGGDGLGGRGAYADGAQPQFGTDGADSLVGGSGNDYLDGVGGADTLIGGAGNDLLVGFDPNNPGNDVLDGGDGDDRYYVGEGDTLVDSSGGEWVFTGMNWTLAAGFENLSFFMNGPSPLIGRGNDADNLIAGNDGDNVIAGLEGDDTLYGRGGSDVFDMSFGSGSSYGNDTIDGGLGLDTLDFSHAASGIVADLNAGTVTGGGTAGAGAVDCSNVECVVGSSFADSITAINNFSGGAVFQAGAGADTLTGGSYQDIFVFAEAPGSANADLIVRFGGAGVINGYLDALRFDGSVYTHIGATDFAADDARFYAAPGAAAGHDASDRIVYDSSSGALYYDADGSGSDASLLVATLQGAPRLEASQIRIINGQVEPPSGNTIDGTAASDTLIGGSGNDTILGFDGNDSLVGNDGDDSLDGGAGADTINGGAGNDTYVVTAGDVLVDSSGTDTVQSDGSWNLGAGFENLTLLGTGNWQVQGNNLANVIIGNSGVNYINSRAGDDTIQAGAGNDSIDISTGGTSTYGNKLIDGGDGFDTIDIDGYAKSGITVKLAAGTMSGGGDAGAGSATLSNIERVVGGGFNDSITGDAGANQLEGRSGNDTLAGAGGVDTLFGGAGNDSFVFGEFGTANADRIGDFTSGADRLLVDHSAFSAIGGVGGFAAGDARFYAASGASGGHDSDDRLVYNTSTGQLYYDDDGSGAHAAQLVATLNAGTALSATDIGVI